ncbi:ABC transporter substrate-binding protein [Pseudothermotoga hypogea DSM 11164 = NBRC 106472]|uniref:ABC transporter substrate-binding protein n=1 Tax=Pseudothermotoga hypogea DSM 11164 = NBRC 106472 TaxID=1123384 RepID=A0A0X1KTC3_9THEM|nr:ABC transporter substrate-binding protein [Pseudothermotoga hypogea]AJC74471.1 ABC transporter substrate-binding protein [Pseudothermotoga hypogea DSM 11164 = NBRC 106472]
MRRFLVLLVLALTVLLIAQVTIPREETVYIAGALWGPATTWNLYAPQSTWGTDQFLFVSAFQYDLGRDAWIPFIAQKYEFVDDKTIRIHIRPEAKWSDGQPITAEDFVYALELSKKLGVGPGVGWDKYIEYVKAIDTKVVEFKAREDALNYYQFLSYSLGAQPMPKHVYSKLEAEGTIRDWVNDKPDEQVVSGPYKLYYYDPNIVIYQRIDNWWGKDIFGLPRPKFIGHVIYKDNPSASLAVEKGDVDWAGLFIPSVWEMWEKKKLPIGTWYNEKPYYLPDGVGFVYLNNTKPGLSDPAVRKAIAHAIPYEEMLVKAYFGYGSQAHPSMVIDLFEPNKQYINYDLARKTWGTSDGRIPFDLAKAKKILDEAGYKVGKDGIRVGPDGKKLGPYTISVPYGWTDWMMMCEMIAENLRSIGIDVVTEFPDYSVWADRMTKGTFDIIISWSVGPSFDHPFNIYRFVLDKRLSAPVGEVTWAGDWQRYDNDEVVELLDRAVSTLDPEVRKNAYFRIQEIIYRDMPSVPAFFTAHWYEYSTKYWINWPNQDNPYWFRPAPWHVDTLPTLFGISPKNNPQPVPKWIETTDKGGMGVPTSKVFEDLQSAKK